MLVNISEKEISLREVFISEGDSFDYMDFETRRLFPRNNKHEYENKIFLDPVAICLTANKIEITIKNCEFRKGFFIRPGEQDFDYSIFLYKSNVLDNISLQSFDAINDISIDTCKIQQICLTGRSRKIDLYGSEIDTLLIENERCELFRVANTTIGQYALFKFDVFEVTYDTEDLAISDYNRFKNRKDQTKKQVSEIYHRIVLKAVKSINSSRKINYQLYRATSSNYLDYCFGYFYRPIYIILLMVGIVILYSFVYGFCFGLEFGKSLYFSAYTFLTIGYGDFSLEISTLKTILVFTEGLLGVTYSAALLTSIINYSKK